MSTDSQRFIYNPENEVPVRRASAEFRVYPLLNLLLSVGIVVGIVISAASGDILMGVILFVGIACVALLWRRAEIPIFAFSIFYQWLFVSVGYFYLKLTGDYPGMRYLGDLDTAIWFSLAGFLSITFGIRFALRGYRPNLESTHNEYDIRKLFWTVLILFSVNWFVELSGVQLRLAAFNVAQILYNVLILRYLFLYLLLLTILQQGRQYSLGFLAFVYVLLPELTSSMTKFKELFFLFVIVLLSQWRPFATEHSEKIKNRQILVAVLLVSVFLVMVGLLWTGGMKHSWRTALLSGQVAGSPIEKIEAYGQQAADSIGQFDPGQAAETLAARLSSGVAYFSHVLRVVPDAVPHENGKLTWRAIRHVAMPRFLFPEKPDLGGDSWLVRKYANLNVSGGESGTSIGLGYMAEFYIDYGFPVMLVPLLLYGMLVGVMYRVLSRVSPSPHVFAAVVAGLFLQHFLSYEGNFSKLLGGVLQSFLVFLVILALLGEKTHKLLLKAHGVRKETRDSTVATATTNAGRME